VVPKAIVVEDLGMLGEPWCVYTLVDYFGSKEAGRIIEQNPPHVIRVLLVGIASLNGWDMSDTDYEFVY
jgi:hypothetical protein